MCLILASTDMPKQLPTRSGPRLDGPAGRAPGLDDDVPACHPLPRRRRYWDSSPHIGTTVGRHLVSSGEFKKSFTTFHSFSPDLSMSLWPTPGSLTSRARPPMALVSSFAIQGRVSASSDPLMIRVGQSTLLALERASNGPMANEVLPMRARSIAQASRLVNGLSSTCALTSRRLARSIATALPRDQPISVTWSRVTDACRCRYVIAASAER